MTLGGKLVNVKWGLDGGGSSNPVASHGKCARRTNRQHSSSGAANKRPSRGGELRTTRTQIRVGVSFRSGATRGLGRHFRWCRHFSGRMAGAWPSASGGSCHPVPGGGRRCWRGDPVRIESPPANCCLGGNGNCCIEHHVR